MKWNSKKHILSLLLIFLFFIYCNDSDRPGACKTCKPGSVYFDYQVSGQEGMDSVTIKLQFRYGGPNGVTLLLEEPSKVKVDGQLLQPDSSVITGVYYETQKPIAGFAGRHTIIFTDIDGQDYKESFVFKPISLESGFSDTISRSRMVFRLKGLDPEDYIRIMLTDTSYTGEGINRLDTVYDGKVVVRKQDMYDLYNGPVQLELSREFEKPVTNNKEGGRLLITYSIRREFFLRD